MSAKVSKDMLTGKRLAVGVSTSAHGLFEENGIVGGKCIKFFAITGS